MSPEAQRVAIAEACGYIWEHGCFGTPLGRKKNEPGPYEDLPDYLNDLNAMHEAEKALTEKQQPVYINVLWDVCNGFKADQDCYVCDFLEIPMDTAKSLVCATAAQRAEAFLRTIGKWEDGK